MAFFFSSLRAIVGLRGVNLETTTHAEFALLDVPLCQLVSAR
jgi:hypothetical protein